MQAVKLQNLCCCAGVNPDLPWICLLPGANCYSQDYTFLETYLAGQGYLVAVVDQLHPVTPRYATCLSCKSKPAACLPHCAQHLLLIPGLATRV